MSSDRSSESRGSQPESLLDIATIHEVRKRLMGMMFARQVEIRQLEVPGFAIETPKTYEELLSANRELEELRRAYLDQRLRRDGEFEALWSVSDLLDELENEALKQAEQE